MHFPVILQFFMNEWFNEKALEVSANKPLSIKTESLDILAASVSSPSTPTQLSKSAPFSALKTNLESSMPGNLGGSMGSAKKVNDKRLYLTKLKWLEPDFSILYFLGF